MPKFSIIVPVYNVEKYVGKCLDSIFNQSFKDYEVIVVNDGSTDNSEDIIKNYNVTLINKKNGGLSDARNKGVEKAIGDYLIFVDSDDYIEKDLLNEINKSLDNNQDVVRYQIKEVDEDGNFKEFREKEFSNKNGVEAFKEITDYHFVENAWCYAIKREYYKKEKFKFQEGTYHEDFGLIPLVIIKAKSVSSISYIGYNYLQRKGSIMNTNDYEKTKKKVSDFYNHYNYLLKEIDKTTLESNYFKSFISNSLILKITELEKKDYQEMLKKIKQENVFENLLTDSCGRKIKKVLLKLSPKIYYAMKG